MPAIEQEALTVASGAILDVGAGAGCHSLALQAMEKHVTAIDISPLAVETMRQRGVKDVREQDFFTLDGKFDTILMLMNGIGIVGALNRLPAFFMQIDHLLAPGGQLLCDSSDLCYLYEDEDGIIDLTGVEGYYGELTYQMQY
jgi:2-polyprenyl-3-methyl-5-hydroxy-6-metoxy-1,4-benzoquinol methylase